MCEWDAYRTELEKERKWAIQLRSQTTDPVVQRLCDDFITVSASFIGACDRVAALEAELADLRAKVTPGQDDYQLAHDWLLEWTPWPFGFDEKTSKESKEALAGYFASLRAAHVAPLRAQLDQVVAERDALMRNEYICRKCGLRKDSEPCDTGGHF